VQLIFRHLNRQPSSQLEIIIVAFSVCSLAIYELLAAKLQDVKTP